MHQPTPFSPSLRVRRLSQLALSLAFVLSTPIAAQAKGSSLVRDDGMPLLFAEPTQLLATQAAAPQLMASSDQPARARGLSSAIEAPDGEPNDRFGASLDRSGDTLVVGAWGAFGAEGLAYVSTLDASGWSTPVELAAPTEGGDQFGWSVATDGTSIAVGARLASEPDTVAEPLLETGAVTFFKRSSQGWEPTQRLYSSNRDEGSAFGFSMAMQNGVALVGEPGGDDVVRGLNESGAAYILGRNAAGTWSETQRLVAPDAASEDVFGLRVALSQVGNRSYAFVAALGRDDRGEASGCVYVFERTGTSASFVYRQKLLASDGAAQDQFGFSISAHGDRLVVGAPGVNSPNSQDTGAVYVFERGSSNWAQTAKVVPGAGRVEDRFGYRVVLNASGDFAASRLPNPASPGTTRGVSVYKRVSRGDYQLQGVFNPRDIPGEDSFGGALSFEQGTVLVGMETAVGSNGAAAGSVEVFETSSIPAPLSGMLGLGGLGLGLLTLRRRRG